MSKLYVVKVNQKTRTITVSGIPPKSKPQKPKKTPRKSK